MVVMLVLELVAGDAVVEMTLRGETRLGEQLHGPVDGRVADGGILLAHGLEEIVTGDVSLRLEEGRENQLTLLRVLEIVLLEVVGEGLQLDFVRHRRRISLLDQQILCTRGQIVVEILGEQPDLPQQPAGELELAGALLAEQLVEHRQADRLVAGVEEDRGELGAAGRPHRVEIGATGGGQLGRAVSRTNLVGEGLACLTALLVGEERVGGLQGFSRALLLVCARAAAAGRTRAAALATQAIPLAVGQLPIVIRHDGSLSLSARRQAGWGPARPPAPTRAARPDSDAPPGSRNPDRAPTRRPPAPRPRGPPPDRRSRDGSGSQRRR